MQEITGDMKLAEVVRRWPETIEVFLRMGYRDPTSGFAARIMTVRSAARMEGIDLAPLLDDLNKAAGRQPLGPADVGGA